VQDEVNQEESEPNEVDATGLRRELIPQVM